MRLQAPPSAPADLIVAGNHPWPGDPMQSFKVLLQHRAACRSGGVLVGLFWTDSGEIDRSFPISALRWIAMTGGFGGWTIRRLLPAAQRIVAAAGSPAAFMLRWACELVVDRTVLVYAPPLRERLGPRLGPVRLFADQSALWHAAAGALNRRRRLAGAVRLRVFPHGGLTYVDRTRHRVISKLRQVLPLRASFRASSPEQSHSGHATLRWRGSWRGFPWSSHSGCTKGFLARGQRY